MSTILEVNQVYKYFGGVKANENISLKVEQGSMDLVKQLYSIQLLEVTRLIKGQ